MSWSKSILLGYDYEAIEILLPIHAVDDPKILDCTYNTGKMWKKSKYKPTRMDIDSSLDLDVVGDFTKMPFNNESFDVIVFDPPHLPIAAASKNSSRIWEKSYGITNNRSKGDNINSIFLPFLSEALR